MSESLHSYRVSIYYLHLRNVAHCFSGRSLDASLTALPYASTRGVLIVISLLAMLHALKVGEASVVVIIVRLGFMVAFLLAVVLMSEKLTPYKALGILFAVLAVVLLSR